MPGGASKTGANQLFVGQHKPMATSDLWRRLTLLAGASAAATAADHDSAAIPNPVASLVDIARQQFTAGQQRLLQAMEGMQASAGSSNGTHAQAAAGTLGSAAAGSMAGSMQAGTSSSPSAAAAAEGMSVAGPETDLQQLLGVAGELGMAENDLQRCLQEQARMLKEANASLRGTARQEHEAR